MMKRTITISMLAAALMCCASVAFGQNVKGGFSIRPMAGLSVSTIMGGTDDDLYESMVNMTGGLEVEYAADNWLGVSLGASYMRMGAKMDGTIRRAFTDGTDNYGIYSMVDGDVHGDYLVFPLLANIYIPQVPGLSLKLGVQLSALVKDRMDAHMDGVVYRIDPDPSKMTQGGYDWIEQPYSMNTWQSDILKSVDFGIPVGLSYEFKNVVLDARYYFGLTKIDNTIDPESLRNRNFSVTLGYRIRLR